MLEFILIFLVLIFVLRKLAPWILHFFVSLLFRKVQAQQNQQQQKQNKTNANQKKTKTSSETLGEYIDYEEID